MLKQYLMKLHAQSADREFDRMKIQKFDRIAKKSLSRRILKKWKEFHQEK